jgi:hypothetical protein
MELTPRTGPESEGGDAALAARSTARAVASQPPPGAAGTNMCNASIKGLLWAHKGHAQAAQAAARNSRLDKVIDSPEMASKLSLG